MNQEHEFSFRELTIRGFCISLQTLLDDLNATLGGMKPVKATVHQTNNYKESCIVFYDANGDFVSHDHDNSFLTYSFVRDAIQFIWPKCKVTKG